jgi:phosphomannomutase
MDDLNLSMFRAYDIRTPAERLTDALAERLARAEAVYIRDVLHTSGVVLAHDARSTGPRYLRIAAEAFLQAGLEVVWLPGPSSTSYFYYAAMRHPRHAAVMIGASHNPAADTGQKLLAPGMVPVAEQIGPEGGLAKLRELYLAGVTPPQGRRGRLLSAELMGLYVDYSLRLAGVTPDSLKGTRILHDYLYGAAGREMVLAMDRAGVELTALHFTPDGGFPLGAPNPVKQDVIGAGLAALAAGDYLLGTFFDGDGDRIDFYRGDGSYLSSSFVYAAILPEICARLKAEGQGVFADLKSNPLAVIEMARAGVAVDVIRNGHSQIKKSLIDDPTRFGAVEESAHFYEAFTPGGPQRYCTENTLYLALLVTRVWHDDPSRFDRLIERQATTAREREWGYKFPTDAARAEALQAVRERLESQGFQSMDRMKNGMDLEATLLRRGLPFDVDQHTQLAADWIQVSQRVSQSENGLARWEVVGATPELVRQTKQDIAQWVEPFSPSAEYQG